jgi:phosphate uptake regulator
VVNALERSIDALAGQIIARHQPAANTDLRHASLKEKSMIR